MYFKLSLVALLALATATPVERNTFGLSPTTVEKRLEEAGFVEGDMRFGGNGRNVMSNTNLRWSGKTVYYEISSAFSASERNVIIGAMNAIQSSTCVRFAQRSNQGNYVFITRENSGCWSYVGMIGGRQQLNLQGNGCVYHGTAIHELLHALGIQHQQSAANRDSYVSIQFNNVQSGTENNFQKMSSSQVTDYGYAYDYNSIMHYDAYAFSKNGQKTIVTHNGASIGQRSGLSSIDVAKIKTMYSC